MVRRSPTVVEQVGGVVAGLDRHQPLPGPPRVGLADARQAVLGQEAHVGAVVPLAQRRRELVDPSLAHRSVRRAGVAGGQVDHDPAVTMGEGGGLGGHPRHRPAQHPQLRHPHRRVERLQVPDDRLGHLPVDGRRTSCGRPRSGGRRPLPAGRSPGRTSAGPGRRSAWPTPGTARLRAGRPRSGRRAPAWP
jgi:hypothetical protein